MKPRNAALASASPPHEGPSVPGPSPTADDSTVPACDVCGQPAVVVIETVAWCDACFHEMGSCCGEWHEPRPGRDPSPP